MSILIKGMEMPKNCCECRLLSGFECRALLKDITDFSIADECPLVPVPPHGRLIDADALRQKMYHEAFETDSDMQKWESGCWIRFKMFENAIESAPTVDAVSVVRCKDCKHRDPEDHKCDSGALERAGCIFAVCDEYFCASGER